MPAIDHYKSIPNLPDKITTKKKRPKLIAVVDEDNCTGCQACVPFCPVDCIEPVPREKYNVPIPPVYVRVHECIGCQICARVCSRLTWDAIQMEPVEKVEVELDTKITDGITPPGA